MIVANKTEDLFQLPPADIKTSWTHALLKCTCHLIKDFSNNPDLSSPSLSSASSSDESALLESGKRRRLLSNYSAGVEAAEILGTFSLKLDHVDEEIKHESCTPVITKAEIEKEENFRIAFPCPSKCTGSPPNSRSIHTTSGLSELARWRHYVHGSVSIDLEDDLLKSAAINGIITAVFSFSTDKH
ncbi:unnamed protein product [Protopolystoma xenopodis]|uniref:Uncharacterized protein n=1 Tax=Protopolystoma xenopodis TaxID=117903 RepID=A0A448WAZ9_9PLAT|nr:unnamed protein product [Protopolystoma xenopodis]